MGWSSAPTYSYLFCHSNGFHRKIIVPEKQVEMHGGGGGWGKKLSVYLRKCVRRLYLHICINKMQITADPKTEWEGVP